MDSEYADQGEPAGASVEEWRSVPGFDAYQVSSLGRVQTVTRIIQATNGPMFKRGRVLGYGRRRGYLTVTLHNIQQHVTWSVHRLVATCFLANPEGLPAVNHLNMDKHDNRAVNLQWVTPQQNQQHAAAHGLFDPVLNPNRARKLTPELVVKIREEWARGVDRDAIAQKYGIVQSIAHRIATGQIWKSAGGPIAKWRPSRRLTPAEVGEIRALLADGVGTMAVARQIGITKSTVFRIRKGITGSPAARRREEQLDR